MSTGEVGGGADGAYRTTITTMTATGTMIIIAIIIVDIMMVGAVTWPRIL